jgi:hAT family C-terminal dimerisation region
MWNNQLDSSVCEASACSVCVCLQVPCASKVYNKCFKVQQALDEADPKLAPFDFIVAARSIFRERWEMLHTPLHAAGYALDPEYMKIDLYTLPPVMRGLKALIMKLNPEDAALIDRQFQEFRAGKGSFGTKAALENAPVMVPWRWWRMYGIDVPELRDIAVRVLAQVAAQTACERDWSTRGHIHSLKRNNLDPDRASDMNYCYKTLRLRHKLNDVFAEDQFYEWDS